MLQSDLEAFYQDFAVRSVCLLESFFSIMPTRGMCVNSTAKAIIYNIYKYLRERERKVGTEDL